MGRGEARHSAAKSSAAACSAAACAGVPQAVAEARRLAGPSGAVLAYGSLYMAGAVAEAAGKA